MTCFWAARRPRRADDEPELDGLRCDEVREYTICDEEGFPHERGGIRTRVWVECGS
jgi:hypothetical protein